MPQNYTRVARIHFGKLSVYQAASHLPAFLLLCSLSQSILNSVPLPLPLPLYRLSAVDCDRFIFTQNGDALQEHTHTSTHTVTHRLHKYFIARVRRARHLNFVIFTKLLKMPPLRKNQSRNPPKKKNQPVTCHAFPARPPLAKRTPAKKNSSKNRA